MASDWTEMNSKPLTDEQYVSFLDNGFLQLTPEHLEDRHHRFFHDRAADLYTVSGAVDSPTAHLDILGDNVRAQIPEVDLLLNDPVVDGALASLLGEDYLVHPHNFCHRSGTRDQVFHQDGNLPWNERAHQRTHRPEWAIVFYYPQIVDETNGPTEIVPGSQYWTTDNEIDDKRFHPGDRVDRNVDDKIFTGSDLERRDRHQAEALASGLPIPDLRRRFLTGDAGSVVLAHYDLFHRGSRTAGPERPRFMYKFNMVRVSEPASTGRQFNFASRASSPLDGVGPEQLPIVRANLEWLAGSQTSDPTIGDSSACDPDDGTESLDRWRGDLASDRQDRQLGAAYQLGRSASRNAAALAVLADGLISERESIRRAASHGLRQAGAAGVATLLDNIDGTRAVVRRRAVAGLGTAAAAATPGVAAAMVQAMTSDPDELVRSNAAYALGHLVRCPVVGDLVDSDGVTAVALIVDGFLDRLAPGAEPDNAFSVEFTRSTVRQSAGYGLALAIANHRLSDHHIDLVIDGPLRDPDRYVQGLVVEGLARTEHLSASARRRMTSYLSSRRWNAARHDLPA